MKFARLDVAFTCCALLIVATHTADALPKQGTGTKCDCLCEAPSGIAPGGTIHSFNTYDSHGLACEAFVGATCNLENPNTGGIATGSLLFCGDASTTARHPATITLPTGVTIHPLRKR